MDKSIEQLKAEAYDLLALQEQAGRRLKEVNQLIVKKSQEELKKKEEPKKEGK